MNEKDLHDVMLQSKAFEFSIPEEYEEQKTIKENVKW